MRYTAGILIFGFVRFLNSIQYTQLFIIHVHAEVLSLWGIIINYSLLQQSFHVQQAYFWIVNWLKWSLHLNFVRDHLLSHTDVLKYLVNGTSLFYFLLKCEIYTVGVSTAAHQLRSPWNLKLNCDNNFSFS